jgi:hypothetical protein
MLRNAALDRILSSALIFAHVFVTQVGRGIYAARDIELPGPIALIEYVVLLMLMGYWLELDSRKTRVMRVWDLGFFIFLAGPFVIAYYVLKTRGWGRGSLTILGFLTVYFAVYLGTLAVAN